METFDNNLLQEEKNGWSLGNYLIGQHEYFVFVSVSRYDSCALNIVLLSKGRWESVRSAKMIDHATVESLLVSCFDRAEIAERNFAKDVSALHAQLKIELLSGRSRASWVQAQMIRRESNGNV